MTAKEQLLREAPGWSEHDAEVALRAVRRAREHNGDSADEWGDISKTHGWACEQTMQRLAGEERAAGHDPWWDAARSGRQSIQGGQ